MLKSCAAALIVLMAATGVSAQDSGEEAKPEKRICKTDKTTGSLTRRTRTCLTKAQWDRLAEGARKNVDNLVRDANQAQGAMTGGGAGGPGQ